MLNTALARGDVSAIVEHIANVNGSGFVKEPLRAGMREHLYALLNAYGVTDETVQRQVTDKDMVILYSTARGNAAAGGKVAARIATKYGAPNPLLDEPKQVPIPRDFKPAPTPAPTPAPDMSKYALARDLTQLRSDMNTDNRVRDAELKRDVREEVEALRKQTTDTMLELTRAIPQTVKGLVADALNELTPVTLHVVVPGKAPAPVGMVHRKLPSIIRKLGAGVNVYLHGPAGSGKTTAGRQCAEAFGIPFYFAAKVESEYMLLGFKDARGETVRTQFREAYEHGGVFLFDELDGSSPSAVVAMNAALANGICPFPDGIIQRHADFKCIAAGNTKLGGASREYVGRNQLDAASVDRFAFVEFGYDDALETALATNADWCKYVQSARRAVASRALKHLITPRATYDGCKLLEAGDTWQEAAEAVLWKGLDKDTVRQLEAAMDMKAPKPVEIL